MLQLSVLQKKKKKSLKGKHKRKVLRYEKPEVVSVCVAWGGGLVGPGFNF